MTSKEQLIDLSTKTSIAVDRFLNNPTEEHRDKMNAMNDTLIELIKKVRNE
jgi:hypothetical protein